MKSNKTLSLSKETIHSEIVYIMIRSKKQTKISKFDEDILLMHWVETRKDENDKVKIISPLTISQQCKYSDS